MPGSDAEALHRASERANGKVYNLGSDEVALVTAPLFHTAALNQVLFPTILKGGAGESATASDDAPAEAVTDEVATDTEEPTATDTAAAGTEETTEAQ